MTSTYLMTLHSSYVGGNPSPLTTHLSRIYGILVPSKGC